VSPQSKPNAGPMEAAIDRAAKELPCGWVIDLTITHISVTVNLFCEGNVREFPSTYQSLAHEINDAIDWALEKEAEATR
jgi:hypothetical protein